MSILKLRRMTNVIIVVFFSVGSAFAQVAPPTNLRIGSSNNAGNGGLVQSVSQFGITWTFAQEHVAGKFANGDWWVVGPVSIVDISPGATLVSGKMLHGTMVNPPVNERIQGYDERAQNYVPESNVGVGVDYSSPLSVSVNSSVITAISTVDLVDNHTQKLHTAAVLTVLSSAPPQDSFRPGYTDPDKTLYSASNIDFSLLARLEPVSDTPQLADVEAWFERPWIDHVRGWSGADIHPSHMPGYGREIANQVGIASLMLHLDFAREQKRGLAIRMIQLGIDFYGIAINGGTITWEPDGGHASGRFWPILFAGLMIGDDGMANIGSYTGQYAYSNGHGPGNPPADYINFGELSQTFYVTAADVDQERASGKIAYTSGDIGLPEWGIRHVTYPEHDSREWFARYRTDTTALAWHGAILATYIMDVKELWNHPPLFDYQDRYMQLTNQPGYPNAWNRSWSNFTENMWDTYRDIVGPPQWDPSAFPDALDF